MSETESQNNTKRTQTVTTMSSGAISDKEDELWPYHAAPIAAGVIIGVVSVIIVRRLRWLSSSTHRPPSLPASRIRKKARQVIEERLEHTTGICFHPPLSGSFQAGKLSPENERRAQALDEVIPLKKSLLQWLQVGSPDSHALNMRSTLEDILMPVRNHEDAPFQDCPEACDMLCALCQRARFGHEEFTEALYAEFCRSADVVMSRWRSYLDSTVAYTESGRDDVDGAPAMVSPFGIQSPVQPQPTTHTVVSIPTSPTSPTSRSTMGLVETAL